jgi:hypothetical protein
VPPAQALVNKAELAQPALTRATTQAVGSKRPDLMAIMATDNLSNSSKDVIEELSERDEEDKTKSVTQVE